jgi:hypothetical protein
MDPLAGSNPRYGNKTFSDMTQMETELLTAQKAAPLLSPDEFAIAHSTDAGMASAEFLADLEAYKNLARLQQQGGEQAQGVPEQRKIVIAELIADQNVVAAAQGFDTTKHINAIMVIDTVTSAIGAAAAEVSGTQPEGTAGPSQWE